MDEISQWFEEEFGSLGFMVTPTVYNPEDFTPRKKIGKLKLW